MEVMLRSVCHDIGEAGFTTQLRWYLLVFSSYYFSPGGECLTRGMEPTGWRSSQPPPGACCREYTGQKTHSASPAAFGLARDQRWHRESAQSYAHTRARAQARAGSSSRKGQIGRQVTVQRPRAPRVSRALKSLAADTKGGCVSSYYVSLSN